LSADDDDILDFVADRDPAALPEHGRTNLAVRVLLLAVAVGATFGAGGLLVWMLTNGSLSTNTTRAVHAYLLDLKNADYTKAYRRLCSPQESLEGYSARLAQARSRGHGIASFKLNLTFTNETLRLRSARGKVTFADGSVESVEYDVQPLNSNSGPSCIDAFDDLSG
jgi:hypothetical protein